MTRGRERTTVYFDAELHRALRIKAAETERTISELVNEAIGLALAEDADDLAEFERRSAEPDLPFESVADELTRDRPVA